MPTLCPAITSEIRTAPATDPPTAALSVTRGIAPPRRILIAEDDTDILNVLQAALRFRGYLPHGEPDGEAAWTALAAENYDLLISDYRMPRLSGLGLLRRLRENANAVPVIILSGELPLDDDPFRRLLAPGIMLSKPASLQELFAAISRLLAPPRAAAAG